MTLQTPSVPKGSSRALEMAALARADATYRRVFDNRSENEESADVPRRVLPCPIEPFWQLEIEDRGDGSETFCHVLRHVLTGATCTLDLGPAAADTVWMADAMAFVFLRENNDGLRSEFVLAELNPAQPEELELTVLSWDVDAAREFRIIPAIGGNYALAVGKTCTDARVFRIALTGTAALVPLTCSLSLDQRTLAVGDQTRITVAGNDPSGCQIFVFEADNVHASPMRWTLMQHYLYALRLGADDLVEVIVHQGPEMSVVTLDPDLGTVKETSLPVMPEAALLRFDPQRSDAVLAESLASPPIRYIRDGHAFRNPEPSNSDDQELTSWREQYAARDGALIDVTLCAPRNFHAADGTPKAPLPGLVNCYASYGRHAECAFSPSIARLVSSGMVYVVLHGRGGGEYGPKWHAAGRADHRLTALLDLEDALDALISQRILRHDALIGLSRSAGSQLFALSAARKPDRFAGLVMMHPMLDVSSMFADRRLRGRVADLAEWAGSGGLDLNLCPKLRAYDLQQIPHCLIDVSLADRRCPAEMTAAWLAAIDANVRDSARVMVRISQNAAHGAPPSQQDIAETEAFIHWVVAQSNAVRSSDTSNFPRAIT
jgi:hypothetical protein